MKRGISSHEKYSQKEDYETLSNPYSTPQKARPKSSHKRETSLSKENKFPLKTHQCVMCGKETLSCCSSCRRVFYCGTKHKEQHW